MNPSQIKSTQIKPNKVKLDQIEPNQIKSQHSAAHHMDRNESPWPRLRSILAKNAIVRAPPGFRHLAAVDGRQARETAATSCEML